MSCNPVCGHLEVLDGHKCVSCQVLAVLHPDDGGLQPFVGDVDGAVEMCFVALGQLHQPDGGFKPQLTEVLRSQVGPWILDWYHNRLGGMRGRTTQGLTCISENKVNI